MRVNDLSVGVLGLVQVVEGEVTRYRRWRSRKGTDDGRKGDAANDTGRGRQRLLTQLGGKEQCSHRPMHL